MTGNKGTSAEITPPIIWERAVQYYRDMLSKGIGVYVRSLGDLN